MGKGSQQSKRKQQTLKNESQAINKTDVKPITSENRVYLGMQQAEIFKQLIQASNEAQAQLNFALSAAGLSNDVIVGGDLDSDSPHFIIQQNSKQ
jgi:hypothetical protein|tara:strand:- start:3564 stop:3848 length:285 start_codon:yes stop_codon:yes gene_type:complete